MSTAITDSKEYKRCQEFVADKEFKRLTSGETAVFADFDTKSADDWKKMRDYLNTRPEAIGYRKEFEDINSIPLLKLQVGELLIRRDEDDKKRPKEPKAKYGQCATTSNNGYVGHIKGYNPARRIRC